MKLNTEDKMIFGLCSMIGKYINIHPNIIRLILIILTLLVWNPIAILYFCAGIFKFFYEKI